MFCGKNFQVGLGPCVRVLGHTGPPNPCSVVRTSRLGWDSALECLVTLGLLESQGVRPEDG